MGTGGGTRLLAAGVTALLVLSATDAAAAGPRSGRGGAAPAGSATCEAGWGIATTVARTHITDVHTSGPNRAIAVGIGRKNASKRLPVWARWDGSTWTTEWAERASGGLLALAADDGGPVWAVGYRDRNMGSRASARLLSDDGWIISDPPTPRVGSETLADASLAPDGDLWAVGMQVSTLGVRRGLVWQRHGDTWLARQDGPARSGFSGVLARATDDVWIVGQRTSRTGIRPLVRHWDGTTWETATLDGFGVDAGLIAIAGRPGGDLWAVGWRERDARLRPLVLRGRDGAWSEVDAPDLGGLFGLLTDVTLDGAGRPWVSGAVYRDDADYAGVMALRDGAGWTRWPDATPASSRVTAIDGDPSGDAWAAALVAGDSVLQPVCEPPASLPGRRTRPPADGPRSDRAPARRSGIHWDDLDGPDRVVPGLPRARPMGTAGRLPGWVVSDRAEALGLSAFTVTYDAYVADLDDDGNRDVFIGTHGGLPLVFMGDGTGYQQVDGAPYGKTDRHGCAFGALGGTRLPDLVCSVGGGSGMGLKANELFLDPGSGEVRDIAPARGLADPFGRGRQVAVLDADGDGDQDVFLGNQGSRYDALPSANRLLLNDGTGRFTWDPASGLGSDRGAQCALPVDLELDGDQDLLICGIDRNVGATRGIMLMRNDAGHFTDVTRALGIRSFGEGDAALAQLGGGPRPDLVQLAPDRIRISIWREGAFRTVFERSVRDGHALALADIDGDDRLDIYIQRGGAENRPDLVLHNDGGGSHWTPLAVPSEAGGVADHVVAFDADHDGRDEVLVLNGWLAHGPTEVISFDPAPGAGGR